MDLRRDQWNSVHTAIQSLYRHAALDEFPIRLIEAVATIVDGEIACYTEVEPERNRVRNVAQHPSEQLEALLPVLGELQLQHPHIADYFENGEDRTRMVSDYLPIKDWHKLDVYQHFYGPLNCEDQLGFVVRVLPGVHLGFVVNRARRSFTEEERTMLDLVRQHVFMAYSNAAAVTRLRRSEVEERPGFSTHGVIHLRSDGSVWFGTDRAFALLDRYWKRPPAGSLLPEPLAGFVREQIRRVGRTDGEPGVHMTRCLVLGGAITVRLVPQAEEGGWMLLLEEGTTSAIASELPPRLGACATER